jgi:hypothetical protein
MKINRRVFFSALLFTRPAQTTSLRVVVLETFGFNKGAVGVLVRHAEPATREHFAQWLQTHPKQAIRIRSKNGEEVPATIFRLRMCFGRGLILIEQRVQIHERDILTMLV